MWQPPPGFPGSQLPSDTVQSQSSNPSATVDGSQEAGGNIVDPSLSAGEWPDVTGVGGGGGAAAASNGASAGTAAATQAATAAGTADILSLSITDPLPGVIPLQSCEPASVIADEGEEEESVQRTADGMMLVGGMEGEEEEGEEWGEGEGEGEGGQEEEEDEQWDEEGNWGVGARNRWGNESEDDTDNDHWTDLSTRSSSSASSMLRDTLGHGSRLSTTLHEKPREGEDYSANGISLNASVGGREEEEAAGLASDKRGEEEREEDALDALWKRGVQQGEIVPLDEE